MSVGFIFDVPVARVFPWLLLGAMVGFAAGFLFARRRSRVASRRVPAEVVPPLEAALPDEQEAKRATFSELAAAETAEWKAEMAGVGERMRGSVVRLVVFTHGTFAGDDPLAIARFVEEAVPGLPEVVRAIRDFTREQVARALGDRSTFSDDYVRTFREATGLDATAFVWSGENHHVARVQGAVRLARAIALHGGGDLRDGDRVLLMGHSHAGQVFAVLSQLVAQSDGYRDLVEAARARGEDVSMLEEYLRVVRRIWVDAVTFGAPIRYGFARGARFRVLHVVNHRGPVSSSLSAFDLLRTRQGDYVHQLGAPGSDWPAPTAKDREINRRLDAVLGVGQSLRAWARNVARAPRVSPQGDTVLIDYGGEGERAPGFLGTGLGHGVYTRPEAMLFHAKLIASHFYDGNAPDSSAFVTRLGEVLRWFSPGASPGRPRRFPRR